MAKQDDDNWKRRRERELEQDEEETKVRELRKGTVAAPGRGDFATLEGSTDRSNDKLEDLIHRADGMIEQVSNLYNMFAVGVEKLAPIERRKQLEQVMLSIQMMSKPTPSALFKANSIQSRYQSQRERWDKLLRDIESGKIKRVTGPKRNAA
jgi:hypothetical protein